MVRVEALTPDLSEQVVRRRLADRGGGDAASKGRCDRVLRQIQSAAAYREMAQTPLMLSLLISIVSRNIADDKQREQARRHAAAAAGV